MDEHSSRSRPEPIGRPTPLPRSTILLGGLMVGLAGDLLLHGSDGPGLNVLLLFLLLAVAIGMVRRRAGLWMSREAQVSLAAGVLLATGLVLRGAPPLRVLAFLAAAAAFALPALRSGAAWMRRSGVSDHLEAVAAAIAHSVFGPLRLAVDQGQRGGAPRHAEGHPGETGSPDRAGMVGEGRPSPRPVRGVLRGILLAAPLLFVFGALFMSADRVFSGIVTTLFGAVDLEVVASHLVLIGLLGWLASGYLAGFASGTRMRGWIESASYRPSVGIFEVGTALALINLLFAAFVLVQLRYLFGGSGLVEVTPGLTYSEYAREGFAQLVVAAALVLPALLASDWLLRREGPRDDRAFRVLGRLQLILLLVVIASAFQRVRVYQDAYGLTESRFYGSVLLGWLALLTLWFAATVLRGRRDRFAFPAVVSVFGLLVALFLANPDARIARTNLARMGDAVGAGSPAQAGDFDAAYLASLSADAVPTLIAALPQLPTNEARCTVASELLRRWGPERSTDWRSWNWSEARARGAVRSREEALAGLCPLPPISAAPRPPPGR